MWGWGLGVGTPSYLISMCTHENIYTVMHGVLRYRLPFKTDRVTDYIATTYDGKRAICNIQIMICRECGKRDTCYTLHAYIPVDIIYYNLRQTEYKPGT